MYVGEYMQAYVDVLGGVGGVVRKRVGRPES